MSEDKAVCLSFKDKHKIHSVPKKDTIDRSILVLERYA